MNAKASAEESSLSVPAANKAATTLLHFAIDLESSVSASKRIELADLEHYTLRANDPSKFPAGALPQDTTHQLESIGRRLWNIFLRKQNLADDFDTDTLQRQFNLRARLFGYLLLGIGLRGNPSANAAQSTAYLVRLGLALSKTCINSSDLDSARIALQKVAEYLPAAAEYNGQDSSHADYAGYYILRIALSWKDDRLDLAEHMYTKATQHTPYIDISTLTTLGQILIQVGSSLLAQSNFTLALSWFRRAVAELVVSHASGNKVVAEANQQALRMHERARLAALGGLLKCLAGLRSRDSLDEASRLVCVAQAEFGPRRVEVLEMLVTVQTAKGDNGDALTELLEALLP